MNFKQEVELDEAIYHIAIGLMMVLIAGIVGVAVWFSKGIVVPVIWLLWFIGKKLAP